jgi:hypothetical protein
LAVLAFVVQCAPLPSLWATRITGGRRIGRNRGGRQHEIVSIVGGLFVVEAMSVIIQVLYSSAPANASSCYGPDHHH